MAAATKILLTVLLADVFFLLNACSPSRFAVREHTDDVLQHKVEALVKGFNGDVGVYVRNLSTGQMAALQSDTLFPTASMIKVPILCAVFDKINKAELKYSQELVYRDSLKYDDGVTGSFRDSTKIPLAEIVMLMITLSDNTASLWLQQLAGTGTTINARGLRTMDSTRHVSIHGHPAARQSARFMAGDRPHPGKWRNWWP